MSDTLEVERKWEEEEVENGFLKIVKIFVSNRYKWSSYRAAVLQQYVCDTKIWNCLYQEFYVPILTIYIFLRMLFTQTKFVTNVQGAQELSFSFVFFHYFQHVVYNWNCKM